MTRKKALEHAARHSGRGNHRAAQKANARAMIIDDPSELPEFLRRSKDRKEIASISKEWDNFLKSKRPDEAAPASSTVNWLKPHSISEEEFALFQNAEAERRALKSDNRKAKAASKVNTVGKRWVPEKGIWIDDATGAPAPTAREEVKQVRAAARVVAKEMREKAKSERKEKAAIPETGILAEFQCRPDTNRAALLLTLEKNIGKMLSAEALAQAVYKDKEKTGPLLMVIKGAGETISKLKLHYELRNKDKASFGLFKQKGKK